ncbi:helix-turn-helix domain-containing protein [Christensenellaceae bacterium 44-20]
MSLGQRIQTILKEQKVKQVEFARTLGISANYVNLIANDKKATISDTLAKLIEESYGYSAQWVLDGSGEKLSANELTAEKAELLKKIQKMSSSEVRAVLAFVNTLESMNKEKGE